MMVFIFVLGTGVSCCGSNFSGSTSSGVFARACMCPAPAPFADSRLGMGGGGAGGAIDELVAFRADEMCGDELLIADIIGGNGGGMGATEVVAEIGLPADGAGDVGN